MGNWDIKVALQCINKSVPILLSTFKTDYLFFYLAIIVSDNEDIKSTVSILLLL